MSVSNRPWGGYFLSAGLMAAGAAALAITLKINFHFGSGLAVTEAGAELQGLSSIVVDVMAALLALATGVLLRTKRRAMGAFCLLLTVAFGAYSLMSAVGFGAAERLSLSETRRAVAADAAAKAKATTDLRIGYVEWLKRTTSSRPRDTKTLLDVASKEIDKIGEVKAVAPALLPDAQARAFASLIGADENRIQLWLVVALATLLVIAKVVGFGIGSYVWPTAPVASPEATAPDGERKPVPEETVEATPTPPVNIAHERHLRLVKSFLDERTVPDVNGKHSASQVYGAFRKWAFEAGVVVVPPQAHFGRLCGELGVIKHPSGTAVRYANIRLLDEKEPQEARAA